MKNSNTKQKQKIHWQDIVIEQYNILAKLLM